MNTKHLTDEQVQMFVLESASCEHSLLEHLQKCEECKLRVEIYRLLIVALKEQPVPAFDFDLSELVLSKLPAIPNKTKKDGLSIWLLLLPMIIFSGITIFIFRTYLSDTFTNMVPLLSWLTGTTVAIMLLVLCIDMYRSYIKKIKSLNLY